MKLINLNGSNIAERGIGNIVEECSRDGVDMAEADLRGARLTGFTFDGGRLERADLTKSTINKSSFRNAELRNANISDTFARLTDFSGADLSDCVLRRADLMGCDFSGADLTRADISWADLSWAVFNGANLNGVVLTGTKLNFHSAALVSHVLSVSAGEDVGRLKLAGLILVVKRFNLTDIAARLPAEEWRWMAGVLNRHHIAGDNAPAIVRDFKEE